MDSIIGKQVRVTATQEELKRSGVGSPIRANGNSPSANIQGFQHKVGKIIGVNGGRDYGDGMYDECLYIVSFEMEDGTKKSIRIPTHYVEVLD